MRGTYSATEMQTTSVNEHGKYSPDEWSLCHLGHGSRGAVVASRLSGLDMRWPENVVQDSTPNVVQDSTNGRPNGHVVCK